MSLTRAKELRQERASLAEKAAGILAKADAEKRKLTQEETVEFDRIHADIADKRGEIDRIEKQIEVENELRESRGVRSQETGDRMLSDDEAEARKKQHAEAFRAYCIGGFSAMTDAQRSILRSYRVLDNREQRAQSVGVAAEGGYLVPQGFSGELEKALKAFGGMREAARIRPTATGNDLPWPTVDDTSQVGEIVGENSAVSSQDVTFGQVIMKAYKYSSKMVPVSIELLQDSAFDLNTELAPMLGDRIARINNTHFTTGTGVSQPRGVVTDAVLGVQGPVGQTTTVKYADLVDLKHSVNRAYRPGARWMLADTSLAVVEKLVDNQGRPLWQPGIAAGAPDTILGYPYTINDDVPAMAANAKSILFGAFQKYVIRDVLGVVLRRLEERYAELGQVAFIAFTRADGRMIDAGTHPIKYYQNSAT